MNGLELDEEAAILKSIMFRQWSAAAALTLLLYEHVITIGDELKFIWRKRLNSVLGLYIFSKYFALIVQSVNLFLLLGPISRPGISHHLCKVWYRFGIISGSILLSVLDYILMLRVYALYHKSARIGLLLLAFFLATVIVNFYCASGQNMAFDSICHVGKLHCRPFHGIAFHVAIGVVTAGKWKLLKVDAPITNIVARDGSWALAMICAIYAMIIHHLMSMEWLKPEYMFMWPLSFFPIACCRIIMNMQTMVFDNLSEDDENTSAVLTSDIDLICMEQDRLACDS